MLQTIQAKPDAAAQALVKDRPGPSENKPPGPNTFYSQYLAALPESGGLALKAEPSADPVQRKFSRAQPGAQETAERKTESRRARSADETPRADGTAQPQAEAAKEARASRKAKDSKDSTDRADQASSAAAAKAATDPADGADPATATSATAPPGTAPSDLATAAAGDQAMDPNGLDGAPGPAAAETQEAKDAAAAAAGTAAAAAWLTLPGLPTADGASPGQPGTPDGGLPGAPQGATATPQPTASPQTSSSTQGTAPLKAATPETIAAAKAQAALEQIVPEGGKVQFQFGDPPTQTTTKPALSEFMNLPKPQLQAPSFAGVGSASGDPVVPAWTPSPATHPDLQALVPAGQASLLNAGPLPKDSAPEATRTPGNFGPAEALGAGGALGAGTSVRITAPKALEPAAPKYENPMTQVDSTIKWLIKNKEQSAELQLHPENLGQVQIKLKVEGNQVHAKVWASEAAALPVLQEHRAFLEASLKDQGLQLGSFDLQHGQQGEQASLPRPEPAVPLPSFKPAPAEPGQEAPVRQARGSAGPGRISIVA